MTRSQSNTAEALDPAAEAPAKARLAGAGALTGSGKKPAGESKGKPERAEGPGKVDKSGKGAPKKDVPEDRGPPPPLPKPIATFNL